MLSYFHFCFAHTNVYTNAVREPLAYVHTHTHKMYNSLSFNLLMPMPYINMIADHAKYVYRMTNCIYMCTYCALAYQSIILKQCQEDIARHSVRRKTNAEHYENVSKLSKQDDLQTTREKKKTKRIFKHNPSYNHAIAYTNRFVQCWEILINIRTMMIIRHFHVKSRIMTNIMSFIKSGAVATL